jgi:hypothetical protein
MSGRVRLRSTPCGTKLASKEAPVTGNSIGSHKLLNAHVRVDCAALQHLAALVDAPTCNGCFPRFIHFSNTTATCYNEFVDSVPLTKYLKSLDLETAAGIDAVKTLFVQAVNALELLNGAGMIHRDLQAQNMLVRKPLPRIQPDGVVVNQTQLVIMDFCWVDWANTPVKFGIGGRHLGRFTRTPDYATHGFEDTYAFACAVADVLYMPDKTHPHKDRCAVALGPHLML